MLPIILALMSAMATEPVIELAFAQDYPAAILADGPASLTAKLFAAPTGRVTAMLTWPPGPTSDPGLTLLIIVTCGVNRPFVAATNEERSTTPPPPPSPKPSLFSSADRL